MACLRCRGKRHASCASCGGRGQKRQLCLSCDGTQGCTAYIKGKLQWKSCDDCHGQGDVDSPCKDCRGCGIVLKTCRDCRGLVRRHTDWLPHARLTTVEE